MKGVIALDIDGTITAERHEVPENVSRFLSDLALDGWKLIFITGRPFAWAHHSLQDLSFPYAFAVQNGALVLEIPTQKIISRHYLDRSVFPAMEEICRGEPSDFVVYGGYENQDVCYFRSNRFAPDLLSYLQERCKIIQEQWIDIPTFDKLPLETFPSVKCFGTYESAKRIHDKIQDKLGFHAPLMRDPLGEGYYVVQMTAPHVTKGNTLKQYSRELGGLRPMIAAGDDTNDESMLQVADIKVVMATAPKHILSLADIVAPSAEKEGIIQGLNEAIARAQSRESW